MKNKNGKYKMDFTEQENILYVQLSNGETCLLDIDNKWIIEKFHLSKVKGHVKAERFLEVEYGYALQRIYLHRLVCGLLPKDKGFFIDHINRNGLDNRKVNLRYASRKENANNVGPKKSSKCVLKGVNPRSHNKTNPYGAFFKYGKSNNLGYTKTEEEAGELYDINAIVHHGDFAYINYPEKMDYYLEKIKEFKLTKKHVFKKSAKMGYYAHRI